MQLVGRTWLNLVAWTCGSWSEGQHDLYFMVQWFCLTSWRLFDVCTSYFGSMNQYDPMFDLKINVGHCDLYSMVQWFCLISWKLFDAWTLLFGIMSQYDPKFDLKINIGHFDLYLGRAKRIWYLSPMRAAKVQASLRIRAVSPEPPHKQWVKRNLQTENQIPGPSEWLGMRS